VNRKYYRQGAAIKERNRVVEMEYPSPQAPAERSHPDAYALAIANKRKSWAKRWLRHNRLAMYNSGLIEISPK
jgi:hypothetical protein